MKFVGKWLPLLRFKGSNDYWRRRYRYGGDSGTGSGGKSATYKAKVLNRFVHDHGPESLIEFGCGDGRQLELAQYPSYTGVDISPEAVALCRMKFPGDASKTFVLSQDYRGEMADVALSLDVIFHLVEDEVYDKYLQKLFSAARRYVVIYSTDDESMRRTLTHVRHRRVSTDVASRFPQFERMVDYEAGLEGPDISWSEGAKFIMYKRVN